MMLYYIRYLDVRVYGVSPGEGVVREADSLTAVQDVAPMLLYRVREHATSLLQHTWVRV